ncbi:DUF4330 domain-containing protein [Geosporobacter ferrireducens]|uniref:DUF4330 domain-containing protein n=1 Tax=Geosporobacter ferrireducens TaxID=1424294 RepID=A0A1D8GLB8_9FIRM|nr:DUF4330 domain-containing protein [Geosporobacter ferrireducens]AOT71706.1 hypothetical protein Gferi_20495 [Geosporobacter ferrireducens]
MKIVDERGRLFGVVNIVDLTLLLVIVLFAGGVYYKLVAKQSITDKTHAEQEIFVTIKYTPLDEAELDGVNTGDQLVANNALQPIYVENVEIRSEKAMLEKNGVLSVTEHPFEKSIYITIKGEASITDANIHMANQIIKIGREFFLKTLTTEWKGIVTNIEMQ